MTYLQFHLVFTLPVILVLKAVGPRVVSRDVLKAGAALGLIALIAFVYTTPWDNYLVQQQVWGYGASRVLGTIGYVPIEEYLFFILQPLLTGLWLYRLVWSPSRSETGQPSRRARWVGTTFFTLCAVLGVALLEADSTLYMGLIRVWAAPCLVLQWAYGGHHLWRLRRVWFWATAVPTVYLWVVDRIAIGLGIWQISEQYTTGWHLAGLPVEEALFFLVTNLLVVQGLLLLLHTWRVSPVYRTPATATA